jgi:hypothetical protein
LQWFARASDAGRVENGNKSMGNQLLAIDDSGVCKIVTHVGGG